MSAILLTSQKGANAVEYAIGSLLFFSLSLAAIESSHWLLIKQSINHALLDSARIAATSGAKPHLIDTLFSHHLKRLPAFHFQQAPQYWDIQRATPPSAKHPIRHSYQSLQYIQGNPHIFEENSLHLVLHYAHKPLTPLLRQFLRSIAFSVSTENQHYFEKGMVLIHTEVQVAMQSDQQPPALRSWKEKETISSSTNSNTLSAIPTTAPLQNSTQLPYWNPTLGITSGSAPPQSSSCHAQQCCPMP